MIMAACLGFAAAMASARANVQIEMLVKLYDTLIHRLKARLKNKIDTVCAPSKNALW